LAKLNEEYSLLTDQYNDLKESYNCLASDQFKKTSLESIENLTKEIKSLKENNNNKQLEKEIQYKNEIDDYKVRIEAYENEIEYFSSNLRTCEESINKKESEYQRNISRREKNLKEMSTIIRWRIKRNKEKEFINGKRIRNL